MKGYDDIVFFHLNVFTLLNTINVCINYQNIIVIFFKKL